MKLNDLVIANMIVLQPVMITSGKPNFIDRTVSPSIKVLSTGVDQIPLSSAYSQPPLVIEIESYSDAKSKVKH